jgi:release factor glutamine methyltransferase
MTSLTPPNDHVDHVEDMDVAQTIKKATKQLEKISDSARLDCELLLCSVLKKDRSFLRAWPEHHLDEKERDSFQRLLEQRLQGKPVAYILGERGFWTLNLKVSRDTLIPRADTERLVELALTLIPAQAPWKILDLGTGTGAIALSLANENPACFITATDQSPAALEIAKQNAVNNQISNIEFIQSDWFTAVGNQRFDMIVSNPPYIKDNDPHLKQGDVRFEPLSALTSGKDGLDDIRTIIKNSQEHLQPNGVLLIEHGYDQAESVCELLTAANFSQIRNFTDYNNIPRVSLGYIS